MSDAWGGSWGSSWGGSWGAISAEHALLANDVQAASSVSQPLLGIVGGIEAEDVQSASSVTTPALGQGYGLLAEDVTSASSVSAPLLGEIEAGTILAEDVISASFVSTPTLAVEGEVIPVPPEIGGGGKVYGRYLTRKRWEELLRELEEERQEAVARARAFRSGKAHRLAKKAARAASEAIAEARETADRAMMAAHAATITRMLEGATHAKGLTDYLEHMDAARRAAEEIEDEDEVETLLMLS